MIATKIDEEVRKRVLGLFWKVPSKVTLEKIYSMMITELEMKIKKIRGSLYAPNVYKIMVNTILFETIEKDRALELLHLQLDSYLHMKGYHPDDELSISFLTVPHLDNNTIKIFSSHGNKKDVLLKFLIKGKGQRPIELEKTGKYILGRGASADITVENSYISKKHIELLLKTPADFYIKDLSSRNGTVVNGEILKEREYRKIFNKDVIKLGKFNGVILEIL